MFKNMATPGIEKAFLALHSGATGTFQYPLFKSIVENHLDPDKAYRVLSI